MFLILHSPSPASGFGPTASGAIVSRLIEPSSGPVVWDQEWIEAAQRRIETDAAGDEPDPEYAALRHRYDAVRARANPWEPEDRDQVTGLAPFIFAESAKTLESAFRDHDQAGIVAALADLAVSAADLADPFLMTLPDPQEAAGARLSFCDLVDPASLLGLQPLGLWSGEPLVSAVALARQSAALRSVVELAFQRRDVVLLQSFREETLGRALSLARTAARRAWERAGSPSIEGWPQAGVRVSPNPARRNATIHFQVVSSGVAHMELFDLAGRKLLERPLGLLSAGFHRTQLGPLDIGRLPHGAYVVRVLTSGRVLTASVVRTK